MAPGFSIAVTAADIWFGEVMPSVPCARSQDSESICG